MPAIEHRFYEEVPASGVSRYDYVVPDGVTLMLSRLGGNAGFSQNTAAKVIWDRQGSPEVLMVTYGDANQTVNRELLGDGVKAITIELSNTTSSPVSMGGFWGGDI
jgi:hypothetical protein